MGLPEVVARVRRLEELTRGLSRELSVWQKGNDPLLYLERRAYVVALQNAIGSLEEARVTLAQVSHRLGARQPAA